MGFFDKIKDTAKNAANTAAEKLSSIKEESDKRNAEKDADNAVIQKLSSLGFVSSFMDRPTVSGYYDFCIDKDNQRFVMRKESDKKAFKKFSYTDLSAFKYLNTETRSSEDFATHAHAVHFDFGPFSLEMTVRCRTYNNKTETTTLMEANEKRKLFDLLHTVIYSINDEQTRSWVNEICDFYSFLPLFDEKGMLLDENIKQNQIDISKL